jgi:hypothetical protein
MTTESLLDSISSWAAGHGLNFTAETLPAPPPFLDADTPGPGVCLTIHEPEPTGQPPAQLGVWIPASLSSQSNLPSSSAQPISYCMMQDGDEEIETSLLPEFTNESELATRLEALLSQFQQDFIFVPALESWLGEKGIKYSRYFPDIIGNKAQEADINSWFVVQFENPRPDYPHPNIIGVSGSGQAATLIYETHDVKPTGYVEYCEFEEQTSGLKTAADLHAWLDANIVLNRDQTKNA